MAYNIWVAGIMADWAYTKLMLVVIFIGAFATLAAYLTTKEKNDGHRKYADKR